METHTVHPLPLVHAFSGLVHAHRPRVGTVQCPRTHPAACMSDHLPSEQSDRISLLHSLDDLGEGKGGEVVAQCPYVLVFLTDGYFRSSACMRELLRAVSLNVPLLVLVEPEPGKHGSLSMDEAITQCSLTKD